MGDLTRYEGTDQDVDGLLRQQQAHRSHGRGEKKKADKGRPIPKHKHGDHFVRGPVPVEWLRVALSSGGKAGNLAWAIWWLAGIKGRNPIALTAKVLRRFCISTRSARRLLSDFERAGLVEVDQQRGRSPIVTLLSPERQQARDT